MVQLHITQHAHIRLQQRGFRRGDPELMLAYATQTCGDRFRMTDLDVRWALSHTVSRAEERAVLRLRGKEMVIVGGHVVTAYHLAGARRSKNTTFH